MALLSTSGVLEDYLEADDVARMPCQELPLFVRANDVVRRARHKGEVTHGLGFVTEGAERSDGGHGLLGAGGRPRRCARRLGRVPIVR
jgi:hypothetical protein